MPDEIKRQAAHIAIDIVESHDEPIDPDDLVDPEDTYDDTDDPLFTDDVDRGGLWSNMSLSCIDSEPVALEAVAHLKLTGISTVSGLLLYSSYGAISVAGTNIPEAKTETIEFVNETDADLSALPVPGTISYRWIGRAPAIDRVIFQYRRVTLPTAFTGLLEVTYTTLYHELQLSAVNEEPGNVTAGAAFDVLAAVSYGGASASTTVQFQDIEKTQCDQGYQDGYADGYADGQADINAGDSYGTSYDATGYDATKSAAYIACYGDGYTDGYNDGYDGDPYDDDEEITYDSLTMRVINCCSQAPVDGVSVYVGGTLRGTTGADGTINLTNVTVGDSLRLTHPDYIDSDKDALNNDRIPRVTNE